MARKGRRQLNATEESVLEQAFGLGMPIDECAKLIKIAEADLRLTLKKDAALRQRIEAAKPRAGLTIRQRLYKKAEQGDIRAIEFYCKTQLGMRTTDRVELTGPNGKAIMSKIESSAPDRDEILRKIEGITRRLKEKYDE